MGEGVCQKALGTGGVTGLLRVLRGGPAATPCVSAPHHISPGSGRAAAGWHEGSSRSPGQGQLRLGKHQRRWAVTIRPHDRQLALQASSTGPHLGPAHLCRCKAETCRRAPLVGELGAGGAWSRASSAEATPRSSLSPRLARSCPQAELCLGQRPSESPA